VSAGATRELPLFPLLDRRRENVPVLDFDAIWSLADELRDVLPIFSLTEAERRELVAHMHVRRFRAAEVVYHRGDPAADTFVVHHGLVKSLLHDEEGRELLIALYGRGDFFGTLSLFEDGPRESTVEALIPTTVLQITRADALHVLERNPRAMYFMFERLTATIHQLAGLLEGIVFLDVPGRLARYLVELERPDGVALTQDDMAAAIGASRERVNKTLADFERRGLIKVERRQVQILDEAELRKEIRP
jgi:CRP/FNR family transcriptional regulator/CRP/FNR family cyclic AMP-dependent transcriptional regulator